MLLLLAAAGHAQDSHAPGVAIDEALAIQLTPAGLDALGGFLPEMMPGLTALETTSGADGWADFCLTYYEYSLENAWVGIEATDTRLVPTDDGVILIEIDALVWVNDASDPFTLTYDAVCLDDVCPGYIEPFPATVTVPVTLAVVEGTQGPALTATLGEFALENGLTNDHIRMDCSLDDVESVLNIFGLSFYDLIIGMAEDQLTSSLEEQRADLEQTLNDALSQLSMSDQTALGDATLTYEIFPFSTTTSADGVEIVLSGRLEGEPVGCAVPYDTAGSLATPSAVPGVDELGSGAHMGALVADDFINQGLYAAWQGGLLCYELGADSDLGIPINSDLLSLFAGDVFEALVEEGGPLVIETAPMAAPLVDIGGDSDLVVQADQLGLELYAMVDERMAMLVRLDVDLDVGVDLVFDSATGALTVGIDVQSDQISVGYNELAPGQDDTIAAGFAAVFDTLIGGLIASALPELSFTLGSLQGLGLTELYAGAGGVDGDWLAMEGSVGPVSYGSDCQDGCGGGGCASARSRTGWTLLLAMLGLVSRRRR